MIIIPSSILGLLCGLLGFFIATSFWAVFVLSSMGEKYRDLETAYNRLLESTRK